MVDDHVCPLHRARCVERSEENYFFALSKYQKQIEVRWPQRYILLFLDRCAGFPSWKVAEGVLDLRSFKYPWDLMYVITSMRAILLWRQQCMQRGVAALVHLHVPSPSRVYM